MQLAIHLVGIAKINLVAAQEVFFFFCCLCGHPVSSSPACVCCGVPCGCWRQEKRRENVRIMIVNLFQNNNIVQCQWMEPLSKDALLCRGASGLCVPYLKGHR